MVDALIAPAFRGGQAAANWALATSNRPTKESPLLPGGRLEALVDSFEWNKIAGWVLTAAIAILGLSIVTGSLYHTGRPEKMGVVVEGVEVEAEASAGGPAEKPIAFYLASANIDKGKDVFKKCAACHTIEQGGANGIGPNLWATVGANHGHVAGFGYSSALLETKGQQWTFDGLNEWLKSPRAYIPGNKMSFAGLSKPEDRANVIAYMNSMGSNLPLPAVPAEVAEAAPDAPAPGGPEQTAQGEKNPVLPSKAPDVPEEQVNPVATGSQPQNNRGGPGAADVTGRAKDDRQQ